MLIAVECCRAAGTDCAADHASDDSAKRFRDAVPGQRDRDRSAVGEAQSHVERLSADDRIHRGRRRERSRASGWLHGAGGLRDGGEIDAERGVDRVFELLFFDPQQLRSICVGRKLPCRVPRRLQSARERRDDCRRILHRERTRRRVDLALDGAKRRSRSRRRRVVERREQTGDARLDAVEEARFLRGRVHP